MATIGTASPTASRKPLRKIAAKRRQQHQRHSDRMVHPCGHERILDDVRGGVGGGERDGDDEAGRRESEQAEDERFAAPAREQLLEHRDAALPVRAQLGDAPVHRQRAEERQQHEDQRGERRQDSGGEERDAGLVAERREIVDAREAHDLPPGRLVDVGGIGRPRPRGDPRRTRS